MPNSIETLAKRSLHEVFGERDKTRRLAAIQQIFSPDCVFSDSHARHVGWLALDRAVSALLERMPDFEFAELGECQVLLDAGRLAWSFGPQNDSKRITGLDVIVVSEGRISALYTFLD